MSYIIPVPASVSGTVPVPRQHRVVIITSHRFYLWEIVVKSLITIFAINISLVWKTIHIYIYIYIYALFKLIDG
jgi:hypothetical protein